MNKALRMLGLAATLTASMAVSTTSASATGGAGTFVGTASINCFGCGDSAGTAKLCVTGVKVVAGPVAIVDPCVTAATGGAGNVTASYTVHEDTGAGCVVSGTASGTTTGAVNVAFNWTRVGAVAVISTTGDINGAGVAAFVVTSPAGLPCGGAVSALVVGALAGT
jgi:hypothetical protein